VISDLKQFIAATISQETKLLNDRIDRSLVGLEVRLENRLEARLSKKIEEFAHGIGDAIEALTASVDGKLDNHETRITKLENSAS